MKMIILPGYSPKNREWAYEVKDNLKVGHKVIVHEWPHWKSLNSSLSVSRETEKILKKVGDDKVNFIAKSVGTRVLMHLTPLLQGRINKVILCGIPTEGVSETAIKIYSEGFGHLEPGQVVVFQNKKDPLANFVDIKKFIGSINPKIKVFEKPRSDHHYPYYEEFQNFLHS